MARRRLQPSCRRYRLAVPRRRRSGSAMVAPCPCQAPPHRLSRGAHRMVTAGPARPAAAGPPAMPAAPIAKLVVLVLVLLLLAVLLLAMMLPMTMIGVTATLARPSCQ